MAALAATCGKGYAQDWAEAKQWRHQRWRQEGVNRCRASLSAFDPLNPILNLLIDLLQLGDVLS